MYFTDNYTAAQPTEFHGFLSHKSRDFRPRMTTINKIILYLVCFNKMF